MALKWIGSMLVLFSAGGFGIWSAMQWRERLRLLEKLRQMIYFLKGEITYSHAPLAEALERVGKREAGPLGQLFTAAAEGLCRQEGESLQEIWQAWGSIWDIWMWTCRSVRWGCTWNSWIFPLNISGQTRGKNAGCIPAWASWAACSLSL